MRLIDADALITFMRKGWRVFPSSELRHTCDITDIENAPTIDAEPVKHGHWIREPNCWYRCSECGSHYPSIADNMNYHYCPDCGAKMTLD